MEGFVLHGDSPPTLFQQLAGQRLERKTKRWSESYINYTTEEDVAIVVWEKPTKGSNLTGDCVSGFIYCKPQGALTDWKKIRIKRKGSGRSLL